METQLRLRHKNADGCQFAELIDTATGKPVAEMLHRADVGCLIALYDENHWIIGHLPAVGPDETWEQAAIRARAAMGIDETEDEERVPGMCGHDITASQREASFVVCEDCVNNMTVW